MNILDINNITDPYCYPKSSILKNNFGITDMDELEAYERALVSKKLLSLYIEPISGNFDSAHYLKIHEFLFSDIYPFAGKIRCVDIKKGNTYFARSRFVSIALNETLNEMKMKLDNVSDITSLSEYLSYYYISLNLLHPFREGNGRCEREFLREYTLYLKDKLPFEINELDYSKMNKKVILDGTISLNQKIIQEEFLKVLTPSKVKKK